MSKLLVKCSFCHKEFYKDIRHINENLKLEHRFYCSSSCQYSFKNKQIEISCENCHKKFKRMQKAISPHNYCSHHCAATMTNKYRYKQRKYIKYCLFCKKEFYKKDHIYCSNQCYKESRSAYWKNYTPLYNKEGIIQEIKKFIHQNKRIPLKREMNKLYQPARKQFGTWNKAIEAAGFIPNPVLFANHQVASDGHICDSMAERIIDDYLTARNIPHERNSPYPRKEFTADFKVGNVLIEYFGLAGQHDRYDKLSRIKKRMVKKHKIRLIEIYPKDLIKGNFLDNLQL